MKISNIALDPGESGKTTFYCIFVDLYRLPFKSFDVRLIEKGKKKKKKCFANKTVDFFIFYGR